MNKFIISGRLTADAEYIHTNEGKTVAKFNFAVNRRFKKEGEQDADFIRCTAFGKSGEFAEKFLFKGTQIAVCGRIQTGSYEKEDGQKVFTTDVIAEEHYFCGSKASAESASAPEAAIPDMPSIPNADDDDLPF